MSKRQAIRKHMRKLRSALKAHDWQKADKHSRVLQEIKCQTKASS